MISHLLKNLSFKRRLLLLFALLSFIPLLAIGIITYSLYSHYILKLAKASAVETIDLVCGDIDKLFGDTYSLCVTVSNNINMQKYLRMSFPSVTEQYSMDLEGSMDLASISTYRNDIFGLYVIGQNGGLYKSNYFSFQVENQHETGWYQTIISSDQDTWFAPHMGSFVVRSSSTDQFISMGIPTIDKASGLKNGIVVADIREDVIAQKIQHGITNGIICILDENGSILFQSGDEHAFTLPVSVEKKLSCAPPDGGDSLSSRVISDDNYLIVTRYLGQPGWQIAGIIDKNVLTQGSRQISYAVLTALILVAIAAFFSAAYISESVSKPVQQLAKLMERVEQGDLSVRMEDCSNDEFSRLGKTFNQMLSQMQVLMDQIYQDQRQLRQSELRALQSQIQPHFLYNSLDSITWLLRLSKFEEAQEMLTAMSSLFKVSLSKGRDIITIGEELRHASSYLFLSKMLYSKKFEYTVTCPQELYPCKTLKLLIQPLIENAINHAVPQAGQKILIHVSVYEDDSNIVIAVQDISMGIPQEKLQLLIGQLESNAPFETTENGYGLYNVNERIHVFWGKEYGIHIESHYGEGTVVSIYLPKNSNNQEGVEFFVQGDTM